MSTEVCNIDKGAILLYNSVMNNAYLLTDLHINSCGATDCSPGWNWDTGNDGFRDFDLWMVCRGSGKICTGDLCEPVTAGSCLILFPNTHYIGTQNADRLLVMNVHFHISAAAHSLAAQCIKPLLHRHLFDLSFMSDCISRVIRLYNSDKVDEATAFFRTALIEYFSQDMSETSCNLGREKRTIINKLCDRINLSPAKAYRLSDIAAEHGYSADYLGRIFTNVVGISFSEYLSNARINQAKHLLSSTELTIEAISEMLGFYDSCYFSRQFRRITGISPGLYRREKGK